jgi:hypothetical protein
VCKSDYGWQLMHLWLLVLQKHRLCAPSMIGAAAAYFLTVILAVV